LLTRSKLLTGKTNKKLKTHKVNTQFTVVAELWAMLMTIYAQLKQLLLAVKEASTSQYSLIRLFGMLILHLAYVLIRLSYFLNICTIFALTLILSV